MNIRKLCMNYTLDEDGDPVEEPDVLKWAKWFETHNRVVIQTAFKEQGIMVSTVFIGINLSFGDGPPLLWETMIFDQLPSLVESYCDRYASLKEAKAGHQKAVDLVMTRLKKKKIIGKPTKVIEPPIKKVKK